ncbi:MAG: hypothetical protein RRY20_05835 [Bilophila sp.]
MRKKFFMVACSAALVCGLGLFAGAAPTPQKPIKPVVSSAPAPAPNAGIDVTGTQWGQSTKNEKLAFLYGASSIVAIEHLIAQKQGQPPSPFVSAWMAAFKDTRWMDLQGKLDAWYAAHPEQANRQVFDVLWFEFMTPAVEK